MALFIFFTLFTLFTLVYTRLPMKSSRIFTIPTVLLLAACASSPSGPLSAPLQDRLRNPLVAERYWSEMAEHMADFTRMNDAIMKDPTQAAVIEAERTRALERVTQARTLIKEGLSGSWQAVALTEDVNGVALLRDHMLYISSAFETRPNPSVYMYLTRMVDPRNGAFPDETSLNLGQLQSAFGEQEYAIPEARQSEEFFTAVLYDTRLRRLMGFAQLGK